MKTERRADATDSVANMVHTCGAKCTNVHSATDSWFTLECEACGAKHTYSYDDKEEIGDHFHVVENTWSIEMDAVRVAC